MAVMTVFVLALAIISGRWQRFVPVTIMVTFVGLYLDATRRGKFVVWAQLLDTLGLRGDERILDLGCGRGAVLLMAAERLTTGTPHHRGDGTKSDNALLLRSLRCLLFNPSSFFAVK